MDLNVSNYLLNHAPDHYNFLSQGDSHLIDLELSLLPLQPDPCDHGHYGRVLVDWNKLRPRIKQASTCHEWIVKENLDAGIHRTQFLSTSYVKITMDGVFVGRKVCMDNHVDYWSLALQLQGMFGKHATCGLRMLFKTESRFTLLYRDIDEQWRVVGDLPWKEFTNRVKRMRIACNHDEAANILI